MSYSSEEQAITMGLSAAEVKFLTALSDLELKKIAVVRAAEHQSEKAADQGKTH